MFISSWLEAMSLAQITSLLCIFYLSGLAFYRLYLSPIAHIPGPLLARLTYWYELYYDVVQGGQYTFKIRELHKQYGPVIRINPDEVHFNDPDFYDEVYAGSSKKRDKWKWQMDAFDINHSAFGAVGHDQHRARRAPMNSFFSNAKVRALQPRVDLVVNKLLERLEDLKGSGKPVRVDHAFSCLTSDVAMEYAFGRNYNRIEHPEFDPDFHETSYCNTRPFHVAQHFPLMVQVMKRLPRKVLVAMSPSMAGFLDFQEDIQHMAREVLAKSTALLKSEKTTVLHDILTGDAAASEKSFEYMWQTGQLIVIAGTLTTSAVLATTIFHLLEQPDCLKELRRELRKVMQNPDEPIHLPTIERLPYLNAVVREGLRVTNGICTRLERIDPEKSTTYVDRRPGSTGQTYVIPPGTPMALTILFMHQDPDIYPDPMAFKPERWLSDHPPADRYFVPFSKGTRSCLGVNLAYAELYLTLAKVFRNYGAKDVQMEGDKGYVDLYKTTARDIEMVGDFFVPFAPTDSNGVRIVINECTGPDS